MNISIGNNRWVKFERDTHGEWRGRGHGYRFRVTRSRGTYGSPQWTCRVTRLDGAVLATYMHSKLKTAIEIGARRADAVATPEDVCPT